MDRKIIWRLKLGPLATTMVVKVAFPPQMMGSCFSHREGEVFIS